MRFVDIIEKKKQGLALTSQEIEYWINGYVAGTIPDYQVAALLMAIVLKGMDERETFDLTIAMRNSGDVFDLSGIDGIKVDKHSTGGVGDKTSLALMPMVAACGAKVAKMSGRGLGFTGGTLDKLESIPGLSIALTVEQLRRQVAEIGIAIVGQTGDLVPADKKLYALRDVTATVDSLPLIASSIMSKKLAAADDVIVLDVKYGDGAFMHKPEQAEQLAVEMIRIGQRYGRKICAIMSSMDQPLGRAVGNALEVKEAIETLKGRGPDDFTELCVRTGALMLTKAGLDQGGRGLELMRDAIASGRALGKLRQMIAAQGGDPLVCDDPGRLPQARQVTELRSDREGYVKALPAMAIGILAMELGAGRATKEQDVDPAVGIVLGVKVGDRVAPGTLLASVHHDQLLAAGWLERLHQAVIITDQPVKPLPVIDKIIDISQG